MRTGIAPRVLSARLRQLASDGFVARRMEMREAALRLDRSRPNPRADHRLDRAVVDARGPIEALDIEPDRFTETSPQSILESLPFLLRDERGNRADVITFEIRLTGRWWRRVDGEDRSTDTAIVMPGFADRRRRPIHGGRAALVWRCPRHLRDARDCRPRTAKWSRKAVRRPWTTTSIRSIDRSRTPRRCARRRGRRDPQRPRWRVQRQWRSARSQSRRAKGRHGNDFIGAQ